ncbi:FtsB family cell division protein [Ferruginibacter sp.]
MKFLQHIPSWLKNKYLISGVAFLIWMLFFDKNDLFLQMDRINHSKELTKNEQYQSIQIIETHKELGFLKTSAQTIEKYARENYMMKKDNEDLFIINSPSESK